eukprot:XP_020397312.1 uncharacterized protein LOC109941201 [Zea mays]
MEKKDDLRKMVVDSKWYDLPDVKSKKGKEATTMVLSIPFWKGLSLCLKVFEPLVKLLRLVDGDVKPSMGFLYGELINAKNAIKEAFGNVEIKYKEVMSIVEKKMKDMLDSPLHVAAYMLNPYYSYTNSSIFCDSTIMEKSMICVETFYHGEDEKAYRVVNDDLDRFQTKQGFFSRNMTRSCQCLDFNPAYLQTHTKRRNRLTTERLNNLIFIQFNNRMLSKKERISRNKNYEVLLSNDCSEAQGFFFQGGDEQALVQIRDEDEDEGEMQGTCIPWSVLGDAMGVEDELQPHRSARVAREVDEEVWESGKEDEDNVHEDIDYEEDNCEISNTSDYVHVA